jgi:hypothetical protein
MCEKCNRHLIEEHLLPLLGKHITTKRNLLLKVESLEAENGCPLAVSLLRKLPAWMRIPS